MILAEIGIETDILVDELIEKIKCFKDMSDVLSMNERVSMSGLDNRYMRVLYDELENKADELQCEDAMAVCSEIKQGDL